MSRKPKQSLHAEPSFNYAELFDAISSIAAQFGLKLDDVKAIVVSELAKIAKKKYCEECTKDADEIEITVKLDAVKRDIKFLRVAGDGTETEINFVPRRRDVGEFLNHTITALDAMRAARERDAYECKKGTAVCGTIEREEVGGYVVNLGSFETFRARGFLPRNETIDNSIERNRLSRDGEKIMVYITEIKNSDPKANMSKCADDCVPRILLSRTRNEFLSALMEHEQYGIFEIQNNLIRTVKTVRSPGIKAKVAVTRTDDGADIDPVGACIGPYGTRIKPISAELSGEKIDIIEWSDDLDTLIRRGLSPARINSCTIHPPQMPGDKPNVVVIATEENKYKAIGARGTNVKLVCHLADVCINISTVTCAAVEMQEADNGCAERLMNYLGIDSELAQQLVRYGYHSTFVLAQATPEDILTIPRIDKELADAIVERAQIATEEEEADLVQSGLQQDLLELLSEKNMMSHAHTLSANKIYSLQDALQAHDSQRTQVLQALFEQLLSTHKEQGAQKEQ